MHSQLASGMFLSHTLVRALVLATILLAQLGHNIIDRLAVSLFREPLDGRKRGLLEVHLIVLAAEHALVMHQDFLRESLKDPVMLKRLKRSHPIDGVPVQAQINEVQKLGVLTLFQHVLERLGVWQATSTSGVGHNYGVEGVFLKEKIAARAQLNDVLGRHSLDLHDIGQLLGLVLAREEWVPRVELSHYAAKGPHVNACSVGDAEDNLRSAVKATLDVGVDALILEATATIVDDLDARLVWLLQKDILRLEIAVDNVVVALKFESLQYLNGEAPNQARRYSLEVVLLNKLVEIHAEQLKGEQQVLAEDGVVQHANDIVFVVFILLLEVAQKTQLDTSLVLEALLVADDFDSHRHSRLVVKALQGLAETARAKLVQHFKPVGQVILDHDLVVATLIVETKVVAEKRRGFDFCGFKAQEVDLLIILNLDFFIVRHSLVLKELEGLAGRNRELNLIDADCRGWLLRVRVIRRRVDLFVAVLAGWVTVC